MPTVDKKATDEFRSGKGAELKKQRNWWTAPKDEAAAQLARWSDNLERGNWSRRWANLTFYRYLTGRPVSPTSYNYAATARPSSANIYSRAQFQTPRYNVLKQCSDALGARVYKERPFIQVCPIGGDFKLRLKAKKLSRWLDAAFYDLKLWPLIEQCGEDCRTWGTAFVKVDADPVTKKVRATRLLQDEVIIDENETNAGEPQRLAIRVFLNRDDLIETYGDNPEALEAIRHAPHATNGLYFGDDLDVTNVVVLREAWSLPRGKIKGRYVLSAGNYALECKEWKRDHFPIAKLTFQSISTSWYGMGMPEMALGMQREVDRVMAAAWENFRRAAWPRILYSSAANINPGSLGDKSNGLVPVTGSLDGIKFVFPEAMSADMFRHLEDTIRRIKEMFRLNDQATMGQNRRELTGVAIEKAEVVDDAAHLPQAQHLEDFVTELGVLLIEAAEECNPTVRLPGRTVQEIKWADVKLAQSSYSLRPFPVGRLSKDMAFRQKQIDTWFAQGKISKSTAMRLEQVPDIDGFLDLANSSDDYVEYSLDEMIETGDYCPPTGLEDLPAADEAVRARYLQEKRMKTPQDRLDLLLKYQAAIEELIDEASPPPAPPAAGPLGAPPGAPGVPVPGMGGVQLPNANPIAMPA